MEYDYKITYVYEEEIDCPGLLRKAILFEEEYEYPRSIVFD